MKCFGITICFLKRILLELGVSDTTIKDLEKNNKILRIDPQILSQMSLRSPSIFKKSKLEIISNTLWVWFMHEHLMQSANLDIHTTGKESPLALDHGFLTPHHGHLDWRILCWRWGGVGAILSRELKGVLQHLWLI